MQQIHAVTVPVGQFEAVAFNLTDRLMTILLSSKEPDLHGTTIFAKAFRHSKGLKSIGDPFRFRLWKTRPSTLHLPQTRDSVAAWSTNIYCFVESNVPGGYLTTR